MHALKEKDIHKQKLVIEPKRFLKLLEQADKSRREIEIMLRSLDTANNA